ncbi:Bdr family repetitive protein [Borrelia duttonii]|nr:Bdr family repetitive protein [Borrelia duttonii]
MKMQPVITRQIVLNELVKVGIDKHIADDLSYKYYKNELTYKGIEYLKENFDIKLKHLEEKIFDIKEELINRMDSKLTKFDHKINVVENNLNVNYYYHNCRNFINTDL